MHQINDNNKKPHCQHYAQLHKKHPQVIILSVSGIICSNWKKKATKYTWAIMFCLKIQSLKLWLKKNIYKKIRNKAPMAVDS